MKRVTISSPVQKLLLFSMVLIFGVSVAQASITLNVTYTADNVVSAFYKNGGSPIAIDISGLQNNGIWQQSTTATLSGLNYGTAYTLYFQVKNVEDRDLFFGNAGNPAGFLAEIRGPATGNTLSSSGWEWALDTTQGTAGAAPPTSGTWSGATQWGYLSSDPTNSGAGSSLNGGNNIWKNAVNGPIQGISTSAHWIWSNRNGTQLAGDYVGENYLWLRTTVTTAVPEPASLAIWSLIAVGAAGVASRRKVRRGRWSDEQRVAIRSIVDRTH